MAKSDESDDLWRAIERMIRRNLEAGGEYIRAQQAAIRAGAKHAVPGEVRAHRALVAICPHARVVYVGCMGRGLMCAYCGELHEHEIMSVVRLRDAGPDSGVWVGSQFVERSSEGPDR